MNENVHLLQQLLDWTTMVGIVSGIVSVVIGILAIGLSVWFFISAKKSESKAAEILSSIQTSTDLLAKITDRHLGRLTDIIETGIRQPHMTADIQNLSKLNINPGSPLLNPTQGNAQETTSNNQITNHGIPGLADPYTLDQMKSDYLTVLFALYYYIAHVNYLAGLMLPKIENYDEKNAYHVLLRDLLNLSKSDFNIVAANLDDIKKQAPALLESHRLYSLGEVAKNIRDMVRDATERFKEIAQENK